MNRRWNTTTNTIGGPRHDVGVSSFKTYGLKEATTIINQLRIGEQEEGKPKRKLKPVSRYILEELIRQYFRGAAKRGSILESITVEDNKFNAT